MGSGQQTYTHFELLQEVKKKYEVYHISVLHSDQAVRADRGWKELLGENCISIEDHREIPVLSKEIICDKYKNQNSGMTGPDGLTQFKQVISKNLKFILDLKLNNCTMKNAQIVIGLGFGDEGKGITTDFLAQQNPEAVVVRFSGGQQAAHTSDDR
jgi:hypothetical protein